MCSRERQLRSSSGCERLRPQERGLSAAAAPADELGAVWLAAAAVGGAPNRMGAAAVFALLSPFTRGRTVCAR